MIYQQDSHNARTRAHQSTETVSTEKRLEEVLALMNDSDDSQQSVYLVIYSQIEKFSLVDEQSLTIGRSDKQTGFMPDVDLMRYNARKHGVSREHACLYRRGQSVYLMDLGSNNGTFVGGKQIMPHHGQMLQHGDVIRLGLLEIQVELP